MFYATFAHIGNVNRESLQLTPRGNHNNVY